MWVCLNNAFLSIIQPSKADPLANGNFLLVRARRAGDIERAFVSYPVDVVEVPGRDYQFRAYIPRNIVTDTIAAHVANIDYGNFKSSVKDRALHDAYACVWGVMAQEQVVPPYETTPRKRRRFAVSRSNPYANDPR